MHQKPPPLCAYALAEHPPQLIGLRPQTITTLLCQACIALGDVSGITAAKVHIKALRVTGAMALLNEWVAPSVIRLIGHWKSDSMLRYLHLQAHNIMSGFSIMLQGGNYALIPSEPGTALPLFG